MEMARSKTSAARRKRPFRYDANHLVDALRERTMRIATAIAITLLLAGCGEPSDQAVKGKPPAKAPAQVVAKAWETFPPVPALPAFTAQGQVAHGGAKIWYATIGTGAPVILLHGAFGNAENFGNQAPALTKSGYRVILIESRGHGRSTRDAQPFTYELMESDVIAVMDALKLDNASVVGWSDGAIVSLIMAMKHPKRVTHVFAFGANMDPTGVMPGLDSNPSFNMLMERAAKDYARLSPTPNDFPAFSEAMLTMLSTEPKYTAKDLAAIRGPKIAIVDGDHEEVIKPEHTTYLAKSIPGAKLIILKEVSHFAPLQKPDEFNAAMLAFLSEP